MNAIRSALARFGPSTGDSEWITWPPRNRVESPEPSDLATLGAPRPWAELQRQGLLDSVKSDTPVGPQLSAQARSGLLRVMASLEQAGVHLAQHRISSRSGVCSEFRILTPQDAVDWIASQPAVFPSVPYVLVAGVEPTPVFNLGDLQVLDALHSHDGAATAPNALVGATLRALSSGGFVTTTQTVDKPLDPLQAYNAAEHRAPFPTPTYLSRDGRRHLVTQAEDILAVDFFHGSGKDVCLADPALAKGLRTLEQAGFTFSKADFDDPSRTDRDDLARTYVTLLEGSTRVVVKPPRGGLTFTADAATLRDPHVVDERAAEVEALYRDVVKPVLGDGRRWESARLFDAVYYEFPDVDKADTCRHLSMLGAVTQGFLPVKLLGEMHAMPSSSGTIDEKVADYCRIRKSQPSDHDGRSTFQMLHTDIAGRATADASLASLHDAFLTVLEHVRDPGQARDAVEVALLPVAGTTFDERARVLSDVAACYPPGADNDVIADYLTLLGRSEPALPLRESSQQFATVYSALQGALKNSRKAHEAWLVLGLQALDETMADRTQLMLRLISQQCTDPAGVYRTLLTQRLADESLAATGQRFSDIHHLTTKLNASNRSLDVLRAAQSLLRTNPALRSDELLQRFSEAMVLGGDVDRAIAAMKNTSPESPVAVRVASDGQTLTIGGIRLARNQGT